MRLLPLGYQRPTLHGATQRVAIMGPRALWLFAFTRPIECRPNGDCRSIKATLAPFLETISQGREISIIEPEHLLRVLHGEVSVVNHTPLQISARVNGPRVGRRTEETPPSPDPSLFAPI